VPGKDGRSAASARRQVAQRVAINPHQALEPSGIARCTSGPWQVGEKIPRHCAGVGTYQKAREMQSKGGAPSQGEIGPVDAPPAPANQRIEAKFISVRRALSIGADLWLRFDAGVCQKKKKARAPTWPATPHLFRAISRCTAVQRRTSAMARIDAESSHAARES